MKSDRIDGLAEDAIDYSDVQSHLTDCGDDLTLLILKGHLVVEHLLERILTRVLGIHELPTRLTFFNKLGLVSAVACAREPGPNADMFCVIQKLNDLRNQLAHSLWQPDEIRRKVSDFLYCYYSRAGKKRKKVKDLSVATELRMCVFELARFLFLNTMHFFRIDSEKSPDSTRRTA